MSLAAATDKFCRVCGGLFHPRTSMASICGPVCATKYAKGLDKDREVKAKAERAQTKAQKEKLKTRRVRIAEAQVAVNRYCRLRDLYAGRGCISCGSRPEAKFGGAMDAGHFRSVGSAPHLRFLTTQIRLQCVKCNRFLSGNVVEFRRALVSERGDVWVQWLESLHGVAKWSEEYLIRLKRLANKKTRRLEKRYAEAA